MVIDGATIGHAADRRRVPQISTWKEIGKALMRGRAKRDDSGVIRLFDETLGMFLVLDPPAAGRYWSLRTIFKSSRGRRYFENQIGKEM
ncbi:hypothetical protein [Oricola sp.]|uniref:hypothetical protein n=1 Tax=Oricola sp. TaxID=1979950 RepID=UPI003BACC98A